ncbi:hypothetical protein ANO11243_047290 [Dothideomycetidae sp. 11243]|nr:hypothetical protein ANO11243_047290 [fungal sp. No.11243]
MSMSGPSSQDPALSTLLFSSASRSISTFTRASSRSKLSVSSRLRSIQHDATFVSSVATRSGLPLIANERCGSWYIPPLDKAGSAYFKSTDGHFGQWSFSLRRVNVQVLRLVGERGGCVLVDSTRRGKSVPDALAKTVPIWAAVWNRVLFPDRKDAHELRTPRDVVSESEHAQIEARLDGFVRDLKGLEIDITGVKLDRPLKAIWVTQATVGQLDGALRAAREEEMYPLVLCTASGNDVRETEGDYDYVQGAADDAEAWACGLKPDVFWNNIEPLMACDEDGLPDMIVALVEKAASIHGQRSGQAAPVRILPTNSIWVGTGTESEQDWDIVIDLRQGQVVSPACEKSTNQPESPRRKTIFAPLEHGKLGSRALRRVLPTILGDVEAALATKPESRTLVVCDTGKDHSVGVALAILCLFTHSDGQIMPLPRRHGVDKDFIKKKLGWIVVCIPDANPSRATLQSVNAVLLG